MGLTVVAERGGEEWVRKRGEGKAHRAEGASHRVLRRNFLCVLTIGLMGFSSLRAQTQTAEPFRVTSDLVLVDFFATDEKGSFVSDLRPEEIEIYENGTAQKTSFFQLYQNFVAGVDDAGTAPTLKIQDSLATQPSRSKSLSNQSACDSHLVILIDLNTTPAATLGRITRALRSSFQIRGRPGDCLMLATADLAGLKIAQGFTQDFTLVEEKVNEISRAC